MREPGLLRRFRTRGAGARRFAAIAGPHGIHVIEYVRTGDGLEVATGTAEVAAAADAAELAELLADAVEALGGRGGELSLGLSGFGAVHHILALPAAGDDVLRPVVRRELLRYYPDLADPVIGFFGAARPDPGPEPKREVLIGAAPRAVAERLYQTLAGRGVRLRHLTVMPRVLQAVYDGFDGAERPAVLLLLLDTGSLIGCFHQGALRLFIEPPRDVHGRPVRDPIALTEQVERAHLFLRQQFANLPTPRVLLAAAEDEIETVRMALDRALELEVSTISSATAGSLAALGVALDAETIDGPGPGPPIQLLPRALRPSSPAERWTRTLASAAAAVLALAAVWWAGAGIVHARAEAEAARAAEARVEARQAWIGRTLDLLERRQGHEHRLIFLDQTAATRTQVRQVMAAVGASAGPGVQLQRLAMEPDQRGWWVVLQGRAVGASSAAAVRAVDALYRGIPDRLPVTAVELDDLAGVTEEGATSVAIAFEMSFIVRWDSDLRR